MHVYVFFLNLHFTHNSRVSFPQVVANRVYPPTLRAEFKCMGYPHIWCRFSQQRWVIHRRGNQASCQPPFLLGALLTIQCRCRRSPKAWDTPITSLLLLGFLFCLLLLLLYFHNFSHSDLLSMICTVDSKAAQIHLQLCIQPDTQGTLHDDKQRNKCDQLFTEKYKLLSLRVFTSKPISDWKQETASFVAQIVYTQANSL